MALALALYFNQSPRTSLYALIAVAIGLHYLIYYVVGKREATVVEAERKANAGQSSWEMR